MFQVLQGQNQPEVHGGDEDVQPALEPCYSSSFSFARGHFLIFILFYLWLHQVKIYR